MSRDDHVRLKDKKQIPVTIRLVANAAYWLAQYPNREGATNGTLATFLKSIRLNLTANGPAAVLIVLIICVAAQGILAGQADRAMSFMYVVLGFVLVSGGRE